MNRNPKRCGGCVGLGGSMLPPAEGRGFAPQKRKVGTMVLPAKGGRLEIEASIRNNVWDS